MAEEIDATTQQLVDSIDESKATMLSMTAQHGSQAGAIMQSLNTYAQEGRSDLMRDTVADDAERMNLYGQSAWIEEDAMADLTQDYDTSLGGISAEMALQQQALINSMQANSNAMANYMDSISAAMPALEERMRATIDMAGKNAAGYGGGGGGGGEGYGPLIPDHPWIESPSTEGTFSDKDDYAEDYGTKYTDEEKQSLADMWGLDMNVWDSDIASFGNRINANNKWSDYIMDELGKTYGADSQEIASPIGPIISNAGENNALPHIDMFNAEFDKLVSNGMHPQAARQIALKQAQAMLQQETWYNDMTLMDPDAANQAMRDLDITAGFMYAGTMVAAGREWDQSVFGSPYGGNVFQLSGVSTTPPVDATGDPTFGGLLGQAEWEVQQNKISNEAPSIGSPIHGQDVLGDGLLNAGEREAGLSTQPEDPRVAGLKNLASRRRATDATGIDWDAVGDAYTEQQKNMELAAMSEGLEGMLDTGMVPDQTDLTKGLGRLDDRGTATYEGEDYDPVKKIAPYLTGQVNFDKDFPMMDPPAEDKNFWKDTFAPAVQQGSGWIKSGFESSKDKQEALQAAMEEMAQGSYVLDSPSDMLAWQRKAIAAREAKLRPPEAKAPEKPKKKPKKTKPTKSKPDLEANKRKLQEQVEDPWAYYQKNFLDYRKNRKLGGW